MPTFRQLCADTAALLKEVQPGARSDPFFVARTFSELVRGCDDLRKARKYLKDTHDAQLAKSAANQLAPKKPDVHGDLSMCPQGMTLSTER